MPQAINARAVRIYLSLRTPPTFCGTCPGFQFYSRANRTQAGLTDTTTRTARTHTSTTHAKVAQRLSRNTRQSIFQPNSPLNFKVHLYLSWLKLDSQHTTHTMVMKQSISMSSFPRFSSFLNQHQAPIDATRNGNHQTDLTRDSNRSWPVRQAKARERLTAQDFRPPTTHKSWRKCGAAKGPARPIHKTHTKATRL